MIGYKSNRRGQDEKGVKLAYVLRISYWGVRKKERSFSILVKSDHRRPRNTKS